MNPNPATLVTMIESAGEQLQSIKRSDAPGDFDAIDAVASGLTGSLVLWRHMRGLPHITPPIDPNGGPHTEGGRRLHEILQAGVDLVELARGAPDAVTVGVAYNMVESLMEFVHVRGVDAETAARLAKTMREQLLDEETLS